MKVRHVAAAASLLVAGLALSGCNTSSLSKRELVVYFAAGAPESEHVAALHACAHATPDATAEPIVKSALVSNQVGDVRFRIDHTDDKQLAILESCLGRQPGVQGVDIPDYTD
ncbi:MAG TPA: hypothetical protein VMH41_01010 [Mycobacteriales bacterium]|nr:hypothetical protein [Mycobacteriales bacterium]